MTENIVQIVKVPKLTKVENSDFLYIAQIGGYQVITNKKEIDEGDLALFVSVESVMPEDFMKFYGFDKQRVKTIKLRGVYSQGLLLPLTYEYFKNNQVAEGDDLSDRLNIHKYEPKTRNTLVNTHRSIWIPDPRYWVYDIESIQHPHHFNTFEEGEEVAVTEKVHGSHFSCGYFTNKEGQEEFFYTQRRHRLVEPDHPDYQNEYYKKQGNQYYEPVEKYDLKRITKEIKDEYNLDSVAIRGEIFGHGVQKLLYGLPPNVRGFVVFDIELGFDKYATQEELVKICEKYGLPYAPVLYIGPFSIGKIEELANQDSVVSKVQQLSEGVVIKSRDEKRAANRSRKILKFISKRYSLKSKPEEEVLDE